jgi:Uma2 family endonuclease
MAILIPDPPPPEIEEVLEHRRRTGIDRYDEVWDGVVRLMPAPRLRHRLLDRQLAQILEPLASAAGLICDGQFNLGRGGNYRIPDRGLYRPEVEGDWQATATLVVEIVSPGDSTWEKLPFYADHGVAELLIVDPVARSIDWLALDAGEYRSIERSRVIALGAAELSVRVVWPAV